MLDVNEKIICSACFAEQTTNTEICDSCGFDNSEAVENTGALPMGMVLLGKYVIGKILGRGGFGITYLAYNTANDKKVAIKEYFPDSLSYRLPGTATISSYSGEKQTFYETGSEKFYNEAKILSRFNGNQNIINVTEFFYENNTAYYVMEYVDGIDLKRYIASKGGKLPFDEVMKIMTPILYALIIVHSLDVLHRDISPDNIYITKSGDVKLLDFGAARQVVGEQSNSLSVILKQGFTPLEQYKKRGNHGPWSDIYSLGATIYYALTGIPPEESINRTERDDLQMPSRLGIIVPPAFEQILAKMLAIKPENRYQSVAQLKEDLQKIETGRKIKSPKLSVKLAKKAVIAGASLLVVAVLSLVLWLSFGTKNVKNQPYILSTKSFTVQTSYTGQWKNNAPNGAGEITLQADAGANLSVGTVLKGEFKNGLLEGEGELIEKTVTKGELTGIEGAYYKGYFKEGLFHGKGMLIAYTGDKYSGDFYEGKPHGQGTLTMVNGDVYMGSFKDGAASGRGVYTYADGSVYEGEYGSNLPNGQGIYKDANGNVINTGFWKDGEYMGDNPSQQSEPPNPPDKTVEKVTQKEYTYKTAVLTAPMLYSGEWSNNAPNGQGVMTFKENGAQGALEWRKGDTLTGQFVNGLLEGDGVYETINGDVMRAPFRGGLANGQGTFQLSDGSFYEGSFVNSSVTGSGTLQMANGNHYAGEFENGMFNGEGYMQFADGSWYDGSFKNGTFEGKGYAEFADGSSYEGEFKDGLFDGQGVFYDAKGNPIYSGVWSKGQLIGE